MRRTRLIATLCTALVCLTPVAAHADTLAPPPLPELPELPDMVAPTLPPLGLPTSTTVPDEAAAPGDTTTGTTAPPNSSAPATSVADDEEATPSGSTPIPSATDITVPDTPPTLGATYESLAGAMHDIWGDGPTLGTTSVDGFGDWLGSLERPEFELDLAVTVAGAEWASSFAEAHAMPANWDSPEAMMAGLYASRTLTSFATNSGDLFAQVQATGIGTPEAAAAWQAAMADAQTQMSVGSRDGLLDPCNAALLTIMASGDAAQASEIGGDDCRTCFATGAYLHEQLRNVFTPGTSGSTAPNLSDTFIPPAEYASLPAWQRDILGDLPGVSEALRGIDVAGQATCESGATGAVGGQLASSVFDQFSAGLPNTSGGVAAGGMSIDEFLNRNSSGASTSGGSTSGGGQLADSVFDIFNP